MNDDVIHVNGKVDPESDIETIATELILADLQTIENQLPRLEKELRGKKIDKSFMDNVLAAQKVLEEGKTLYAAGAAAGVDLEEIASLQLMTTKPFIYVFNTDEAGLADTEMQAKLSELVAPAEAIFLDAQFEPSWPSWKKTRPWRCSKTRASRNPGWTSWPGLASIPWGCRPI